MTSCHTTDQAAYTHHLIPPAQEILDHHTDTHTRQHLVIQRLLVTLLVAPPTSVRTVHRILDSHPTKDQEVLVACLV